MTERSLKTEQKAQYARPKLAVYGEFSKLTASGSFASGEGTGMSFDNFRLP